MKLRLLLASALAFGVVGASARADEAFYANKTITFIVGLDAGTGSDLSCRVIAQYMAQHIAGKPTIIVKNMPGTAAIIADNYVGNDARKDGLTVACGAYGPSLQLFHTPGLNVDFTKFDIVSGDGDATMIYGRTDMAPGMKSGQDIFAAKNIVMGGTSVDSQKDVAARAFLDLIGIKDYKYVTGFTGDPSGRAAMEQKFINVFAESMTSYDQVTSKTMVKDGEAIPIVQNGNVDANGKRIRDPRAPDVPTFGEFYQAHFGKPPSGPVWQVMDAITTNVNVALNWMALPPNSPPAAVAALRAAIDPLNKDPDFVADSAKVRGPGKFERSGEQVQTAINAYFSLPPDVFAYYQHLVDIGRTMAVKKQ